MLARLPKVPPRLSPGNALAIPHEEPIADLCSDGAAFRLVRVIWLTALFVAEKFIRGVRRWSLS